MFFLTKIKYFLIKEFYSENKGIFLKNIFFNKNMYVFNERNVFFNESKIFFTNESKVFFNFFLCININKKWWLSCATDVAS